MLRFSTYSVQCLNAKLWPSVPPSSILHLFLLNWWKRAAFVSLSASLLARRLDCILHHLQIASEKSIC